MINIKNITVSAPLIVANIIVFILSSGSLHAQQVLTPQLPDPQVLAPPVNHEFSLVCSLSEYPIEFSPQQMFDETDKDTIWLHRLANKLHITTKKMTLENEAAFFTNKCEKSEADLEELERHLRNKKYIRDARVTFTENKESIEVKTWDNWSLLPTLSFGRKGGKSTYSLGMKERNLLGYGIDTEIEAYSNVQRSGYRLSSTIPLFQKQNTDIRLRFADNDDGVQHSIFLHKAFAGFHTDFAYRIGYNEEQREDTIYQNGDEQSIFQHELDVKVLNFAWLDTNTDDYVLRYRIGVTQDQHIFSALSEPIDELPVNQLPKDREFLYPWFDVEYIEKDFRKQSNIHLISQIEDFNVGWQVKSRLGVGDGSNENSGWMFWQSQINKGFSLYEKDLLLLKVSLAGDIYKNGNNRLLAKVDTEYFYQLSKHWGFYFNNVNTFSENQYLDRPVTMGGNTGLRGFPLQYQHGKNSIKMSTELRYYPNINIYKLLDIAGTVFADTGRAFGGSIAENNDAGWLQSFGIGARIYSPHSGGNNHVVHIDFAFPQSSDPDIDNFEIRIETKQSF